MQAQSSTALKETAELNLIRAKPTQLKCCIPTCQNEQPATANNVYQFPVNFVAKLRWLEIICSVFPEVQETLKTDHKSYGVCSKHFADHSNSKMMKKKASMAKNVQKGPEKKQLEQVKLNFKCCIPGCKQYTKVRPFDLAWIDIPKQVFRNFKVKSKSPFICVGHFDEGNWSRPSLTKLEEYRGEYLKRFLGTRQVEVPDFKKSTNEVEFLALKSDSFDKLRISDTNNSPGRQSKKLKLDMDKFYAEKIQEKTPEKTPETLIGFPEPMRTSTPFCKF